MKQTEIAAGPAQGDITRRPILLIASGRGKTGKSVLLSWLGATRKRKRPLRVIDADPKNATLSARLSEAEVPPSVGEDRRLWLEKQIDHLMATAQTDQRFDVLLDLGGGDLLLKRWGHELDLSGALIEEGVDPVLIHMVGPDDADISHLADVEKDRVFAPPRTVVMLNAGLVPPTRLVSDAFNRVGHSAYVRSVLDRGGRLMIMPSLDCMMDLEQANLSFGDVLRDPSIAREKLGSLNLRRTLRWLRDDMPAMAEKLADWLPE